MQAWSQIRATVFSRTGGIAAVLVLFAAAYALLAWLQPFGQWDAYAFWNTRAKWMALEPQTVFAAPIPHLDYPPLLPVLIATGWRVVGQITPLVPIILHGACYLALLWLVRSKWVPLLLIGAAGLPVAASQYADLPLALCILGAVIAYQQKQEAWAGLVLGLAALTKNEGLLILVVFMMVWVIWERRLPTKTFIVAAPLVAVALGYKAAAGVTGIESDIIGVEGTIARLLDPRRWLAVGLGLLMLGLSAHRGLLLVFAGAMWLTRRRVVVSMPLLALALVWLGYVGIYLITPHNIGWHMTYSYDRLLWHLFPAVAWLLW